MGNKKIKLFASDCDGVLTSGITYYSAKGEELKAFNMRDGKGIELLKEAGIIAIIITEERSMIVQRRAEKLGIAAYCCVKDKLSVLKVICEENDVKLGQVAYVGDDINDIDTMREVGWSFAPADALDEVKAVASKVMSRRGGEGAVREAIDWILKGKL